MNETFNILYINRIKEIAKKKKIPITKIANEIGMTQPGFSNSLKNNSLKVKDLIKICDILEVDIKDLLSEQIEELREESPSYGLSEKDILKEILKTVKRLEAHLIKK